MSAIYFVWRNVRIQDQNRIAFETQVRGEQLLQSFETRIQSQLNILDFIAEKKGAELLEDPDRFTSEITHLLSLYPYYQALNWIDSDWVIRIIVPSQGNEPALDTNLREHKNETVTRAIQQAIDTNQIQRTAVIDLLQGGKGFATYRPIRNGNGELLGLLNGVFVVEKLADYCTNYPYLRETFQFLILGEDETEIFLHGNRDYLHNSPFGHNFRINIVDQPWTMVLAPSLQHIRSLRSPSTTFLALLGSFLAMFLSSLMYVLLQRDRTLRESEAKYRLLVENQTDMIVKVDSGGKLLFASPSYCKEFGRTEAELIGTSFIPIVHPEDRERVESELKKTFITPYFTRIEERAETIHGYRWQEWLNTGVLDQKGQVKEIIAVGRDITDQKNAQLALERSENRFRNLVEQAGDAFFLCDSKGRIRDVNQQASMILGYEREELLRMSITDISINLDQETLQRNYSTLELHRPIYKESIHRSKDGTLIPVDVSVGLLETGEDRLFLSIARDIRERKKAELERQAIDRQLQQTQKLESLGVLAGGIAHDFNNILLAIIGNAALALEEEAEGTPTYQSLNEIDQAANRAAELCQQMLAYSGKGRFVISLVDLNEVIEEMGHILQVSISRKSTLTVNRNANLPPVEVDLSQVRQVLLSLVTNASESFGNSKGEIHLSTGTRYCDRAFLKTTELGEDAIEGDFVYIQVKDSGIGMDEETLRKIFDPFFSTKFTGRGLGLAAVLGIIRSHSGTIRLESKPNTGTTATVFFPIHKRGTETDSTESAPSGALMGGGLVLVVDDDQTIRNLCTRMIERMGYSTLVASGGHEAIRIFEENRESILCVLLDLTMPDLGGEETFDRIMRVDSTAKVIVSSGFSEEDVKARFQNRPIRGQIHKPFQYETLEAEIRRVLTLQNETPS